jgi:cell division protease FtsH
MAAKERKERPKINKSAIGFDDVVGHKQIKERLKGIIKIINNRKNL